MGQTLPVTRRLITQEGEILKTHTYHQITISPGPAQHPQRGFDQQRAKESEGAHRPRTAAGRGRRMERRQASFAAAGWPWDITWLDRNSRAYQWLAPKVQTALQLIELNVGNSLVPSSDRNIGRVDFTCMWYYSNFTYNWYWVLRCSNWCLIRLMPFSDTKTRCCWTLE